MTRLVFYPLTMFWGSFFCLVHSKFPIPNGRYQKKKSLGDGGSNNFDYIRSEK